MKSQYFEALAYHLVNFKEEFELTEIKKCFLSFGVLNFYEEQVYSRLLKDLNLLLNKATEESKLLNDTDFNVILMSIGMLQIHEEKLIDDICAYLVKNKTEHSKMLLLNFVVSCANINYIPKGNLDELIQVFKQNTFDFNDSKQSIQFFKSCMVFVRVRKAEFRFY